MQTKSLSFNDRFALGVTKVTSTMPTAYIFCAISLISLPAALASHDAFVIVSWISQSFLQLVLLPIIMVGQHVLGDKHDHSHRMHQQHSQKLDAILAAVAKDPR